jgi:uncharacterized membrane protein YeaQ/YmgE (transglycosylase-associated protein family)
MGVFGAFVGGEFIAQEFGAVKPGDTSFQTGALMLSFAGAVVALLLLHLMRRAIGPMKKSKPIARKRDF